MAQWADASNTTEITDIEHSSVDVGLANFDPNYDPTYDLEANCPMCRTHTTAAPDTELAKRLESKYPVTYAERRLEEDVDRGSRVGQNGVEGMMILIGNTHKLIQDTGDANEHDWTFFVRTSRPDLVKAVRIDLVSHIAYYFGALLNRHSTLHSDHPPSRSAAHPSRSVASDGATLRSKPPSYYTTHTLGSATTVARSSRSWSSRGRWTSMGMGAKVV